MMNTLLNDLRYALRTLHRNPGFTAVAVLTLALGIGANTAIFSIIDSVLLRPLPYDEPDRVVAVWNAYTGGREIGLSEPEFIDHREGVRSFEHLAAYDPTDVNLTGGAEPERLAAARVTANVFDALGVDALVGRTFTAAEDVPGRDDVVILSYELWQRRFGGDPAVVGTTVRLNGTPRTVVGVMPASFKLPQDFPAERPTELWVPLALDRESLRGRGSHYLLTVGRLRPGATVAQANAEFELMVQRWAAEGIPEEDRFTAFAKPVRDEVVGDVRPALLVLFGAVGFVLLIACANVANLLLARTDGRSRELAVRMALGAGRRRIMGQLLTESVLLAAFGGGLGLFLAVYGVDALVALDPADIPRFDAVTLDGRVLAFTAGVTVLTGLLFGAIPALRASRPELVAPLKEGGRGATSGRNRQRSRRALVIAEIALSVVLVIGAGLMIRSFLELRRIELGFEPEDVLTLRLSLPAADYPGATDIVAFYRELDERVAALPGVRAAGAAAILPLASSVGDWGIDIEGRAETADENFRGYLQVVTPGYFEAMGLERARGRFLEPADRADGLPAIVISEAMAERYWPAESAIGKRFRISGRDGPWFTVVGVVRDVRHNAVADEPRPVMYFPHAQLPLVLGGVSSMTLAVRTTTDPLAAFSVVREAIRSIDPNLPVSSVRSMEQVVDDALAEPRFTMTLLAGFAAVALTLAAIGIYGVIAYTVAQRTHEIGVRMALGASRRSVVRLVVGNGAVLAALGIVAGVGAALFLTRLMAGLVYGVGTLDPATFVLVPALLAAVALAASWIPARRAASVDPLAALRGE